MSTAQTEAYQILISIAKNGSTSQNMSLRTRIILCHEKRKHNQLVADDLGCSINTVHKWVGRWESGFPTVSEHWDDKDFQKRKVIVALLQDAPRSGAPPTYSSEQISRIIALACRHPQDFGGPITHWTIAKLAEEAVDQGIVENISETTLRRFLKSGRFKTLQAQVLAQSKNR